MPTVESAEKQALIQMLREEVVLEYTGHGYSEHRDLNAEETAQGILDSEWLRAYVDTRATELAREYHEDQCVYQGERDAARAQIAEAKAHLLAGTQSAWTDEIRRQLMHEAIVILSSAPQTTEPDLGDGTAPPEENFWDDRTTPGAYSRQDSERDLTDRVTRMLTRGYVRTVLRGALNAHDGSWGITNAKADEIVDKLYPDEQAPTKEAP